MEVEFVDDDLDRLETDDAFTMGLSPAIVKSYRRLLQAIRAAPDERDFRAHKSLRYEKLKGRRQHQRSMRLNQQFRLVLELVGVGQSRRIRIVAIEDYH